MGYVLYSTPHYLSLLRIWRRPNRQRLAQTMTCSVEVNVQHKEKLIFELAFATMHPIMPNIHTICTCS